MAFHLYLDNPGIQTWGITLLVIALIIMFLTVVGLTTVIIFVFKFGCIRRKKKNK